MVDEQWIPTHYPLRFVAYLVDRYGCSVAELLRLAGLETRVLEGSQETLPAVAYFRLMEEGRRIAGDEGVALAYGNSLRLSDLGLLGYTVTSEATLGDAITLLTRHYGGQAHLSMLSLQQQGKHARLRVRVKAGLTVPETRFLVESVLAAVAANMERLGFRDRYQTRAEFAYPAPGYASLYRNHISPRVHFNMETHALVFPAAWLARPLQGADSRDDNQRLQLEALLSRRHPAEAMVERVEELARQALPERLTLGETAAQLGCSERALQRRLQARGDSLRGINERVRMQLARQWLLESRAGVAEIGRQLGFQEPASFTRAFRNWAGVSPSRFRREG